MSSFWRNFRHWLHRKLSFWQLSVQPVARISSNWRHFRFSDCVDTDLALIEYYTRCRYRFGCGKLTYYTWCRYRMGCRPVPNLNRTHMRTTLDRYLFTDYFETLVGLYSSRWLHMSARAPNFTDHDICTMIYHDDVIKWKHFPRYWPFVRGTHRWPEDSPHKGQQHWPGPRFNIKMTSYQYRKSHCGDKTILRPSYLNNGISYTGKMTSLYWIRTLVFSLMCAWTTVEQTMDMPVIWDTFAHFMTSLQWSCFVLFWLYFSSWWIHVIYLPISHRFMFQCWPRFISPYDVTRPQWVNTLSIYRGTTWKQKCRLLTKFSSLTTLEVVILTIFSAASNENFLKMTIYPFQWRVFQSSSTCLAINVSLHMYGSAEGPPRGVKNRNLVSHPDDLRMEAYVIRMT